jgi:UDP-2,3-diacylglucosamine hydrolase
MAHKPLLFISDLHLDVKRPRITQAFFTFLERYAVQSDALYILGDFFNVWLGDDAAGELESQVAKKLHTLSSQGVAIYLMHGNRDFLIGNDFAASCGANLIEEPYILLDYEQRIILMHGDVLCTRDIDYMAFRDMVRQPDWQQEFLARPLQERRAYADQARQQSKTMSSNKPEDIMDVTQEAVTQLMQTHKASYLIHGHTHRPAVHTLESEGKLLRRLVLSDWEDRVQFVRLDESGLSLETAQH